MQNKNFSHLFFSRIRGLSFHLSNYLNVCQFFIFEYQTTSNLIEISINLGPKNAHLFLFDFNGVNSDKHKVSSRETIRDQFFKSLKSGTVRDETR
jgi:hypothetical protein